MLNKNLLKSIEKDLENALKEVGGKHGVEIRFGGGTFDEADATIKFKISSGMKNSDEYLKQEWDKHCNFYGFKPEHFGKKALYKGDEVQLTGFNRSKPKNCINFIKIKDGNEYMCSRESGHGIFGIPDEDFSERVFHSDKNSCKYCGKKNGSPDPNILCPECRQNFGHTFYSEL